MRASAPAGVPAGYVALDPPPRGTAAAVCLAPAAAAVRAVLDRWGTLYAYAAAHPARVELRGRAAAYAVPLRDDAGIEVAQVVVRHGWRGGALRRVRRDLFRAPTRAPAELAASERLRAAGVPTPRVVAYALYPAPLGMRRVDVATALVPDGADLAAVLAADAAGAATDAWLRPTVALLVALARVGARHPDLNLKNVLLAPAPAGRPTADARAWVLDVDVVRLPNGPTTARAADHVLRANLGRLDRSLRKWGATHARPTDRARRALVAGTTGGWREAQGGATAHQTAPAASVPA